MREVPSALQAMLDERATTLCHGWRITRRDGLVQGFTDHDRDLMVDGLAFIAASGIAGSESAVAQGLGVTGAELHGALSDAALREEDLASGRYDGASVDQFLIDWSNPENRMLLRRGTIGEVRREGGSFIAELRSPADALNQVRGRVFGALCDADLGDPRCGIDLAASGRQGTGSVVAVEGALRLAVSGLEGFSEGTFTEGRVAFTSGANAGFATEVKVHAPGILQLWQRPPQPMAPGDGFTVTAGCDKRFSTCRDRFGNQDNFRGFPQMPGNDFVVAIAVPGEGGHDGSVLK
ncbi:DUF2163 domain-containing protein [Aquabacter sp. CN5-332]|uniref:DUF2163 domain-containing protein n=1 Tax=Aquabacter sp. CN5-332 TaxID=3156608 RepID=UPI0032B4D886